MIVDSHFYHQVSYASSNGKTTIHCHDEYDEFEQVENSAWLCLVKWKHIIQSPTIRRRLIRVLAKRDPQRCRKRLSIGNSIVTRYFQNVPIKSLYFVNFPLSFVLATREKNLEFTKARTKRYDKSLIAVFNAPIFYLKQKLVALTTIFAVCFHQY